ncbi:hypothetical protein [Pilimelia columellifera]|uniref:Uncharacterized protein n=1 Tax=Pilimelia columellifera subsp. columellifera TaxID=706583 RepID=A0ABP6AW76_9ACTN
MDISRPRAWLMMSLASVLGAGVVAAPTSARAAASHAQHVVVDDRPRPQPASEPDHGPTARVMQWATGGTDSAPDDLAPSDVRTIWDGAVAARRAAQRACYIPTHMLDALRQISDGTLAPEVRNRDVVIWQGRGKEPRTTARKWAGSAEFRVERPGKPNEHRILIHPSGRIGFTMNHYSKIREYHPRGDCGCAAQGSRRT